MSAHCEYYQELISRMLDGDLSSPETDTLREHIRTCPECRAIAAAFSGMTLSLRGDEADPPVSPAGGVMSRIRAYEAEMAFAEPETIPEPEPIPLGRTARPSHPRRKTPTLRSALVAACLVVVIGAGALATFAGRGGSAMETAEAPAAFSRVTADSAANAAAGIPEAAAEEAETEAAAPMAEPQEAAPMEEAPAAEAEAYDVQAAAEDPGSGVSGSTVPGYTLSSPAYVPAGSETAFDGLISEGGAVPELSYHAFFYVEHNGVIYEFLTDEDEQYLLWRDAAEGFPTLSQGSFDDLWAIFK